MIKSKVIAIAKQSAVIALLTLGFRGSASANGPNIPHFYVPELDPYTIGAGLTVFAGAAALLIERYRRRH